MIQVRPDYQGVVYSPNPVRLAQLLTELFGGNASHPHEAQSLWELPGVGKWKIDYAPQASGHIPLRISVNPAQLAVKINQSLPEGFGLQVQGEKHWRLISFFEVEQPEVSIGYIHFANRD